MGEWIDGLARRVAAPVSRRAVLKRIWLGLGGAVLASLVMVPREASAGSSCKSSCRELRKICRRRCRKEERHRSRASCLRACRSQYESCVRNCES